MTDCGCRPAWKTSAAGEQVATIDRSQCRLPEGKVFLVMRYIEYEGHEVVEIHATKAAADAETLTPTGRQRRAAHGETFETEDWEVSLP